MRRIFLVALLSYISSTAALSQFLGNAGTIYGVVTDPSGARVPAAEVSLADELTRYQVH
jgi:hypothetical protein